MINLKFVLNSKLYKIEFINMTLCVISFLVVGQIWGNLISSLVFSERGDNATTDVSLEALQQCGANDCPSHKIENNTNLKKPEITQV